jgi:hypothetical protein
MEKFVVKKKISEVVSDYPMIDEDILIEFFKLGETPIAPSYMLERKGF